MSLKVCLISPYAYKLFRPNDERVSPFSGSEVQLYQLGLELAKDPGFSISFMVGEFFPDQPFVETVAVGSVSVKVYKSIVCGRRNVLLDGLLDFWRLFRVMRETKADVYLIRGGGSLIGKVATLTKLLGKRFVYASAHDRESNLTFIKDHGSLIGWLFRFGLMRADRVIAQHRGQQAAFQKNFGLQSHLLPSLYPIAPPVESHREHILWVSRLQTWKQPEVFVELAKRFPQEKFLLITSSNSAHLNTPAGQPSNLEVLQGVPFNAMDGYFQKAKLFINTSLSEGFPNTFIQAAKNKTPIVSLHVNPDNILGTHQLGYCADGDIDLMTKQMRDLLENQQAWSTMSENAYHYAREHHDIRRIVVEYKKLFQDVVAAA